MASNPCRVLAASNPSTEKEIRPAKLAELDVLVKEMGPALGAVVLRCAWCALRAGEVLELPRRDIDLDRGVVSITGRCPGSGGSRWSARRGRPQPPAR